MKKTLTEFIGTFFLVMGAAFAGGVGAALALMVMVYAGGHISGAHYNPAVSFAVYVRRRLSLGDMIGYWMSQIAGALAAGLVVSLVFERNGPGDCAVPDTALVRGLVAEFLGTFALAYVVLNVATAKTNAGNSFYGLAIGGTVLAMALTLGKFSGGAYNPAVGVGLALQKSLCWQQIWIYLVGPLAGGLFAGWVFNINNKDDR